MQISFYTCPGCGAGQTFEPGTKAMVCGSCGATDPIEIGVDSGIRKLPLRENMEQFGAMITDDSATEDVRTTTCPGCGAEISIEANTSSGECSFCGGTVTTDVAPHPSLLPHYVTPFAVANQQALDAFRKWLSTRKFAPNKLKQYARQEDALRGVYYPCWSFDADTYTNYTGRRGINRTERYTTKDSQGKTVTRTRTRTDWYPTSGRVTRDFRDLVVPANNTLPENLVRKLNLTAMLRATGYDRRFLAGFRAEAYSKPVADGFREARKEMDQQIRTDIRRDIGGDQQQITSMQTAVERPGFAYVLLPIWSLAYRFRKKVYRVLVNGLAGDVVGQRPYSVWKIIGLIFAIIAVIGLGALAYFLLQHYGVIQG